jgi:NAD(P)H-flavin reductase
MQEYLAQVIQVNYLTMDVLELHVRVVAPEAPVFLAGQFMQFKIGDQVRSYSMANPPTESNQDLVFVVKLYEKGVGSDFVRQLKRGDEFSMRGPAGNLTVTDFSQQIFFIANGVGVAPYASIIPDLLSRGFKNDIRLLFGLRNEESAFYYHKFTGLTTLHPNFKFTPILSRPQSHWPGETGRVTTYLDVSYTSFKNYQFYLCGSMDMVKDARQILLKHGHAVRNIKLEIFT